MNNCLIYFKNDDKVIRLVGIKDIDTELPFYLSTIPEYEHLSDMEKISDEELTKAGIHVVLYDKSHDYVIIYKDNLSNSYSGTYPSYRQAVESAYLTKHGKDATKDLSNKTTSQISEELKNVQIIRV